MNGWTDEIDGEKERESVYIIYDCVSKRERKIKEEIER